jgi:hypothetical protein
MPVFINRYAFTHFYLCLYSILFMLLYHINICLYCFLIMTFFLTSITNFQLIMRDRTVWRVAKQKAPRSHADAVRLG